MLRGRLDVRRRHARHAGRRVEHHRRVVAEPVRILEPVRPERVRPQLPLALAHELRLHLLEIVRPERRLRDLGDHLLRRRHELVDARGIAPELDREHALALARARHVAARAHAVRPAQILAQHLAQPDRQHLAERVHVTVLVERPLLVPVEQDLHARLRLLPDLPLLLHDATDQRDARVLLLLLAAVRGEAAEVLLDERLERREIDGTHDHEREVRGIAEPVLVERERAIRVDLLDLRRRRRLAPHVPLEQHVGRLQLELGLGIAQLILERLRVVSPPHADRVRVLARRRHAQVDELQHRLEVLRGPAAVDALGRLPDARADRHGLARERLPQGLFVEVTDPTERGHRRREARVAVLLRVRHHQPARRAGTDRDGVRLVVRGLDDHLHAVRERPLDGRDRRDRLLGLHRARLRLLRHQRRHGRLVLPRRQRRLAHLVDDREHALLRRQRLALGPRERDHAVLGAAVRGAERVQLRQRHRRQDRDRAITLARATDHELALVEVARDLVDQLVALLRGLARRLRLVEPREVRLRAIELGLREAVLVDPQHLREQRAQRLLHLPGLRGCRPPELVVIAHEALHAGLRPEERRIGLARERREALVHQLRVQRLHHDAAEVGLRRLGAVRDHVRHLHDLQRQLLVGVDRDARPVGLRHAARRARPLLRGVLQIPERGLDLRLDRGRILEVADGDDRHQVRAVPVLVESHHHVARRLLQRVDEPDRIAIRVARALQQHRQLLVEEPLLRATIPAPLLDHDAALLVELLGVERHVAGPVVQDVEALRDERLVVGRHRQLVGRGVELRGRVEIRAEAHADRLEVVHDRGLGEPLRAVEAHVLDEVREAALVVVLLDGARVDREPEVRALLGLGVLHHVVREAVRQHTAADLRP